MPSGAASRSFSRQNCGLSAAPGADGSYVSGNCSRQPEIRDFHADVSGSDGAALREVADRLHQLLGDEPAVADDRHVGPAHLALFGGIDVDVDDLGIGRERRRPCP